MGAREPREGAVAAWSERAKALAQLLPLPVAHRHQRGEPLAVDRVGAYRFPCSWLKNPRHASANSSASRSSVSWRKRSKLSRRESAARTVRTVAPGRRQ